METAQIIKPTELEECGPASLLEILIEEVRRDEQKTSMTKKRNIKKILKEIIKRLNLPTKTADYIIERGS